MRRVGRWLLVLFALVAIGIAAAHQARRSVAEQTARYLLVEFGLTDFEFRVAEIGWGETLIEEIASPAAGLTVRSIRLSHQPSALVRGRLGEVQVDGLRLDASQGWREVFAPLLADQGEGESEFEISRIEITDAAVTLAGPLPGEVSIEGAISPDGDGPVAKLDIALDLAGLDGAFRVTSDALEQGAMLEIEGDASLDVARAAELADFAPIRMIQGRAETSISGALRLPVDGGIAGVLHQGLALAGDLQLIGVAAGEDMTIDADLGWSLESGGGAVALALTGPGRVQLNDLPKDIVATIADDDADIAPILSAEIAANPPLFVWRSDGEGGLVEAAGEARLALGEATAALGFETTIAHDADFRPVETAPFKMTLEAQSFPLSHERRKARLENLEWRAAGTLNSNGEVEISGPIALELADLNTPEATASASALEGVITLRRRADTLNVAAEPGLALTLSDVSVPDLAVIPGSVGLSMARAELAHGPTGTKIAATGRAEGVDAVVSSGGEDLALHSAGGRFAIALDEAQRGELIVEDAAVALPGHSLALEGFVLRWPLGPTDQPAEVSVAGRVSDTARARRFPPVDLALTGERTGSALNLAGSVDGLPGGVSFAIDVTADTETASGEANFGPTSIRFRRKRLQPNAFHPSLAALRDVEGAVEVRGGVRLDASGATETSLKLILSNVAAQIENADVEGLSGALTFSSVAPLVTAGVQRLRARRVIAGVPVENADIRFSLAQRRGDLSIRLHEASADLASGTVSIANARWNTRAASNAVDLEVRNVSLERLLREWRIEEISGVGSLSGAIPIRVGRKGAAVTDGRIAASGPGVLRVDWGSTRQTLAESGQQVELAVRALEDFHYQILSIGVDQPAGGPLTLAVRLEGANPEVLDGHPINFNVNLSGDVDGILAAMRHGRRIGSNLLRGGFGASP